LNHLIWRLVTFGAVGVLATFVHFVCVRGLVAVAEWRPLPANLVGWCVAFAFSFAGHFFVTFRSPQLRAATALRRFFAVAAMGFVANQTLYAMLIKYTSLRYDWAVIVVSLIVAGSTYLLSRMWAFK